MKAKYPENGNLFFFKVLLGNLVSGLVGFLGESNQTPTDLFF